MKNYADIFFNNIQGIETFLSLKSLIFFQRRNEKKRMNESTCHKTEGLDSCSSSSIVLLDLDNLACNRGNNGCSELV